MPAQEDDNTSDDVDAVEELLDQVKKALLEDLPSSTTVEDQIATLVRVVGGTETEAKHRSIIKSLEEWLSVMNPGCHLLPFGSAVSGLASRHSDLDMFLHRSDGNRSLSIQSISFKSN